MFMLMSWSWPTDRASPWFSLFPERKREKEREQFFDVLDVNNDDVMTRAELTQLFDAASAVPFHAHTHAPAHSRERAFSKERSNFSAHFQNFLGSTDAHMHA
jgi:hypothetical protein